MIYTDMTRAAAKLMCAAHGGQLDRTGLPYIFHPWHVAEQMTDEVSCAAALLHDVLEDTDTTADDLLEAGISAEVVEAVKLLTHDPAEDYFDYVRRIRSNPAAKAVKLADLAHNSDLTRMPQVTERDLVRNKKYAKALAILKNEEE